MQLSIFVSNIINFPKPHSSVPWVKRPGRVIDDASSSNALHIYLLPMSAWPVRGTAITFLHEKFDLCKDEVGNVSLYASQKKAILQ